MSRLARDGKTLTHAFVASPSCAPSRAALLTGLYPVRNGAMFNHAVPDPRHKRWPVYFRELGYETAAIGKTAHYTTVIQYGFDHASHFGYHQDDCVIAATDWLRQRKTNKPLCLIVGTNWPHVPWPQAVADEKSTTLPPPLVDTPETRAARARYGAAVANADRDLGLMYDSVQKVLGPNTLFLFSSDHGSQFPFGKWNCYDSGIRSPLIAVWPGKIEPGSRSDAMVSWIDLLPTFLEAAGTNPPAYGHAAGEIDGRSILPVLLGQKTQHRDRIFTTHSGDGSMNEYPMRSVRDRDWKYIRNLSPEAEHHTHVDKAQNGDGKQYWTSWVRAAETDAAAAAIVQRYHRRAPEELYDLASDPWEMHNLANDPAHAERLKAFRGELDAWMADHSDRGLETERALSGRVSPRRAP